MVNRLSLVIFLVLVMLTTHAMPDSLRQKVQYYNTFTSGMMIGCGDCLNGKDFTASFNTFHGVALSNGIRLGLGTGLELYNEWRIIPLLAGITWDKQRRSNAFYFHINGGYGFGSYLRPENNNFFREEDRGGFTVSPMIGYRIGKDRMRFYIQAGYKYQRTHYGIHYEPSIWRWGPWSVERDLELQRIVVQIGFGIN